MKNKVSKKDWEILKIYGITKEQAKHDICNKYIGKQMNDYLSKLDELYKSK